MGQPSTDVITELVNAESSLHMEPHQIESEGIFLVDKDKWAKHSLGHIRQAFSLLCSRLQSHNIAKIVERYPNACEAEVHIVNYIQTGALPKKLEGSL